MTEPKAASPTAVQREQEWLRDLVGAPRLPLLGCSTIAHDRLDFCASCVRPFLDGWPDGDRAELLGWQLLALRQDEVATPKNAEQHEHLWADWEPPGDDGTTRQWCPRCGERRVLPPQQSADCPVCGAVGMAQRPGEAAHCLPNVPGGFDQRTSQCAAARLSDASDVPAAGD